MIASYNWGEGRVIRLLKDDARGSPHRNFWKFVELYRDRLPRETYGYVLDIVAAAVIGENPRVFGIHLDNPISPALPPR